MPDQPSPQRYMAVKTADGHEQPLGIVSLDAAAVMTIEAPEPGQEEALERLVGRINKQDVRHESVAPPPDSPRFAVASRVLKRGDPGFIPAMKEELVKYYDVELKPL